MSAPPQADAVEPQSTAEVPQLLRVVIAEDDFELRKGLVRAVRWDGHEVIDVANGLELLDYLASWLLLEGTGAPVDVIVTDVRMPGLNGLRIIDGLRASGWGQPVIVMTAFGDDDMRSHVAGMSETLLLEKPFDPSVLLNKLALILQNRPTC